MGEAGAEVRAVNREMRRLQETTEEDAPVKRHVITIEDVTRNLGLDRGDEQRVQKLIGGENVTFHSGTQTQRITLAKGKVLEALRAMKQIPSDTRMELTKRAMEFWRRTQTTDYAKEPTVRYIAHKSLTAGPLRVEEFAKAALQQGQPAAQHKYIARKPDGFGGWLYRYADSPNKWSAGKGAHEGTTLAPSQQAPVSGGGWTKGQAQPAPRAAHQKGFAPTVEAHEQGGEVHHFHQKVSTHLHPEQSEEHHLAEFAKHKAAHDKLRDSTKKGAKEEARAHLRAANAHTRAYNEKKKVRVQSEMPKAPPPGVRPEDAQVALAAPAEPQPPQGPPQPPQKGPPGAQTAPSGPQAGPPQAGPPPGQGTPPGGAQAPQTGPTQQPGAPQQPGQPPPKGQEPEFGTTRVSRQAVFDAAAAAGQPQQAPQQQGWASPEGSIHGGGPTQRQRHVAMSPEVAEMHGHLQRTSRIMSDLAATHDHVKNVTAQMKQIKRDGSLPKSLKKRLLAQHEAEVAAAKHDISILETHHDESMAALKGYQKKMKGHGPIFRAFMKLMGGLKKLSGGAAKKVGGAAKKGARYLQGKDITEDAAQQVQAQPAPQPQATPQPMPQPATKSWSATLVKSTAWQSAILGCERAADELSKARSRKYTKREATRNPKHPWRYTYPKKPGTNDEAERHDKKVLAASPGTKVKVRIGPIGSEVYLDGEIRGREENHVRVRMTLPAREGHRSIEDRSYLVMPQNVEIVKSLIVPHPDARVHPALAKILAKGAPFVSPRRVKPMSLEW